MAIFWSCADARRSSPKAHKAQSLNKREIVDSSEEMNEDMIKEWLVGFLLSTIESKSGKDALAEKFMEAMNKKWDSLDEFANHISKTYEEVTGLKLSESSESNE